MAIFVQFVFYNLSNSNTCANKKSKQLQCLQGIGRGGAVRRESWMTRGVGAVWVGKVIGVDICLYMLDKFVFKYGAEGRESYVTRESCVTHILQNLVVFKVFVILISCLRDIFSYES